MSRSSKSIENPARRFFKWKGKTGELAYWDKERGESGENVIVPLPFTFLVLDELSTIRGFCKQDDSGFWSNEVKSTTKQPLTVRTKAGIKETGLYRDLKTKGIKYAKSVYIAFRDENKQLHIGNIAFVGASLSAWIDFTKKNNVRKGAVTIRGASDELTNGDTRYYEPVFYYSPKVSDEAEEAALELDRELQEYLRGYFQMQMQNQTDEVAEDYITARNRELESYDETEVQIRETAQALRSGGSGFIAPNGEFVPPVSDDDITF